MEWEKKTSFSEDAQRELNRLDSLKKRVSDCDNIDDLCDALRDCAEELLKSNTEPVQIFLRSLYDSDNRKRLRESFKSGDESIFKEFPDNFGIRDKVKEITLEMIQRFESVDNKDN
jgi:hypothetical protein